MRAIDINSKVLEIAKDKRLKKCSIWIFKNVSVIFYCEEKNWKIEIDMTEVYEMYKRGRAVTRNKTRCTCNLHLQNACL